MLKENTFTAFSTTGTSSVIESTVGVSDDLRPCKTHSVQAIATGTATDATLRLLGSLDGTNFVSISPAMDVQPSTIFCVLDVPA